MISIPVVQYECSGRGFNDVILHMRTSSSYTLQLPNFLKELHNENTVKVKTGLLVFEKLQQVQGKSGL